MFAHPANTTGLLGLIAGTLNSVPSNVPSPLRLQTLYPSLDAQNSQQGHSRDSFALSSHPYQKPIPSNHAALPSHGVKSESWHRIVADISSPMVHTRNTSHNGLPDGKRNGSVSTHSRQGSAGKLFAITMTSFSLSHRRAHPGSAVSSTYLPPSYTTPGFDSNPDITAGRSNAGLPPTLWMSPTSTSTSPSTPSIESYGLLHCKVRNAAALGRATGAPTCTDGSEPRYLICVRCRALLALDLSSARCQHDLSSTSPSSFLPHRFPLPVAPATSCPQKRTTRRRRTHRPKPRRSPRLAGVKRLPYATSPCPSFLDRSPLDWTSLVLDTCGYPLSYVSLLPFLSSSLLLQYHTSPSHVASDGWRPFSAPTSADARTCHRYIKSSELPPVTPDSLMHSSLFV